MDTELDPLLARAADTAFDHKIELSRDGAPPILSSPSSSAPHENATPIDVAPATEVSTRKENDVSSPSEPSVIVPATAVIHVEEHDSGEGNTDVQKEASAQEPKRELAKSAEPGVLVDASYDPLFHLKDSSDGSSTPGTPYLLSPPMTPVAAKPICVVSGDVDSAASAPKIAEPTTISSVSVVAALNNSLQGSASAPSIIPASSPSALFAGEFVCIYLGLQFTSASRLTVFLYTSPFVVALLLPRFVLTERLRGVQWVGLAVAFAAVGLAFSESFLPGARAAGPHQLLGDAFGLAAGALWGLTTIALRTTRVATASAEKALFYQLGVTAVVMPLLSLLRGEAWSLNYSAWAWTSAGPANRGGRVCQLPGLDVDAAPLPGHVRWLRSPSSRRCLRCCSAWAC